MGSIKKWAVRIWIGIVTSVLLGIAVLSLVAFLMLDLKTAEAQSAFTISSPNRNDFYVTLSFLPSRIWARELRAGNLVGPDIAPAEGFVPGVYSVNFRAGIKCGTTYRVFGTFPRLGGNTLHEDVTTLACPAVDPNATAANMKVIENDPSTRLGREFIQVQLTPLRGHTQPVLLRAVPVNGGPALSIEGHPTNQVPQGALVLFAGAQCETQYRIHLTSGSVNQYLFPTTGGCLAEFPIYDGDNEIARDLCWRFPGCPASLVFLVPVIVGGIILSITRHPALTLGGGAVVYMILGTLLTPNVFVYLFFGLAMGAAVLLWRVTR